MGIKISRPLISTLAAVAVGVSVSPLAHAGGFGIREQSTSGLGAAFAGNAAGYDLSTIFWNPAGVATAGPGVTTESHAALIIPDAEVDPDEDTPTFAFGTDPNEIGKIGFVPSSYGAYRINDKLTVGFGFNAPFGLAQEADNKTWAGQFDFREAQLLTYNFNPVVGYQISPTLAIGVGAQIMYSDLELKQASQVGDPANDLTFDGQDWSFGFTVGMLWKPLEGTSIGVGYRSQMNNTLEGDQTVENDPGLKRPIEADFDLPSILTVSFRQDINTRLRVMGTFEWTNWDVLGVVNIDDRSTGANLQSISANWDDGYFLSGGMEYDYSDKLTLRGGVGYEWSPQQDPEQRLVSIPDNDRVWLSIGATYKWSETTTIDLAYTHIFIEDARIEREEGVFFQGEADSSGDIIGVSVKTKWGADGPLGLLKGFNN